MSDEYSSSSPSEISFDLRDEFNRRPIAEKLIKLIDSDIDVSPMIIDGNWGTGKSEFCRKFVDLLEEKSDYQPVYIDAFKADHTDEPFLTILSSILKLVEDDKQPELIKKIMPAVRFGLKTTMKAGVSWLLKQDAADIANDFDSDLKMAGDEIINGSIQTLLSDHIKAEQNLDTLTTVLKELSKDKPIVIFIDELDRCRPDFAVAILENIKHIFDVLNVHFMLVTNKEQLVHSINHRYGGLDANQYLDKFIRFSFILPEHYRFPDFPLKNASVTHFKGRIKLSLQLKSSGIIQQPVEDLLISLIVTNNLSLRQVETLVKHLELYEVIGNKSPLNKEVILGYVALRTLGVFLYLFQPAIVKELKSGIFDSPTICRLVGPSINKIKLDSYLENNTKWVLCFIWLLHFEHTKETVNPGLSLSEEWTIFFKNNTQSLFDQNQSSKGNATKIVNEVFGVLSFEKIIS